jgi:DnaK suppressor protein
MAGGTDDGERRAASSPGGDRAYPPQALENLESERQAALRRLAALERDFASIVESAGQANTDDEHDPEGATLAYERQHVAALLGQARDYLRELDAAQSRLAAGQYGLCARCGGPIPADRLAVRPTATSCVTCADRRR